jgi:hypothetical protein
MECYTLITNMVCTNVRFDRRTDNVTGGAELLNAMSYEFSCFVDPSFQSF